MEATKRPLRSCDTGAGGAIILDAESIVVADCGIGPDVAERAALIVRAVNCHEDLVTALRQCLMQLAALPHPDDFEASSIDDARAALAKAEA